MQSKKQFLNREISWLSFNERVLQQAQDKETPLVERMRFLGIFSNNLDEFYKVRVASLHRAIGLSKKSPDTFEFDPRSTLSKIHKIVALQQKAFEQAFGAIVVELEKEGIRLIDETRLTSGQKEVVATYFKDMVRPLLIPILLDSKSRFPELKDNTTYFAIELGFVNSKNPSSYALLEIPSSLPRFFVLPGDEKWHYVMFLDDVIRGHLQNMFSIVPFDQARAYTIKIVRDAELNIDDDLSKSMVDKMTRSLSQRKIGSYVRLNYDAQIPKSLLQFILKKTKITDKESIIPGGKYHNKKDLMSFPDFGKKHLCFPPHHWVEHPDLKNKSGILDIVRAKDILLFFPYHPFSHIIEFLWECSIDPSVSAIRVCLYRVAQQSQVVNTLIAAARNGKKVIAVVEIQARFDEENNIEVVRRMQEAGIRVIPGVNGLKVHSKIILVSRSTPEKKHRFSFIGTGNLHEKTASVYSDISLLTANKDIGNELRKLFEFFETNYHRSAFRHLLVSPFNGRRKIHDLIQKEIANAEKGKPSWIRIKLNNLVDPQLIKKLYEAGDAGVKVDLCIRGTCCLIGESPGLSKNIRVRSIVGRYLEHSRVLSFCNNRKPLYFISSADWMTRNLDHRVEVTAPVYDPVLKKQLAEFMNLQFEPGIKAHIVDRKYSNHLVPVEKGIDSRNFHDAASELIRSFPENKG